MKNIFFTIAAALIFAGDSCAAGNCGDAQIVVFTLHGSDTILSYDSHPDTAFVRYGSLASPGRLPYQFDTFYVGEGGEDHIHCKGLKCGDYYVYRTACDSARSTRYIGDVGVTIPETMPEVYATIPVN